jgi:hypothetical protein
MIHSPGFGSHVAAVGTRYDDVIAMGDPLRPKSVPFATFHPTIP